MLVREHVSEFVLGERVWVSLSVRVGACVRVCGACRVPSRGWGLRADGVRCFFFNDTETPEIYTLSLHDALPI